MKFVKTKLFGKQKGITLVETSIGLAIAAVIVGTAYAGFESNSRRNEVQTNASLITEMISDAKKMFGQPGRYPSLTTDTAITSRVIPDSLVISGTAVNSYGGNITFVPGIDASTATVGFASVPKRQCMDLVMALAGSVQNVEIGGVEVFSPATGATPAALNMVALDTNCNLSATADLIITFGRG